MTLDAGPLQQLRRQMFFALVGPHVTRLYPVVRHLLAYHVAVRDLLPGELAADEVVDAVLVRAYGEYVEHPPRGRLRSWLLGLTRAQLAAEVGRLKSWRERTPVRTADEVPEILPTESVSRLGEEMLEFYEPDEGLKVEDVIADLEVATPEEEREGRELRSCLDAALAGLPDAWRALLLRHYDGELDAADLARAAGKPEPEVQRTLEHAREYLRQRLVESGRRPAGEGGR
jgi:RNA polymerase sigma factor (sigma-70 family)